MWRVVGVRLGGREVGREVRRREEGGGRKKRRGKIEENGIKRREKERGRRGGERRRAWRGEKYRMVDTGGGRREYGEQGGSRKEPCGVKGEGIERAT